MNYLKRAFGIIALMVIPILGISQDEIYKTIEKGDVRLNPYITLGWYDYGYGYDVVNILPPVGLNFEIATSNYFSFGLEADYGLRRYRDFFFTPLSNEYEYTYKSLGFRGSFHYLDWIKDLVSENIGGFHQLKLDLYAGVSTGIVVTTSTTKWSDGVNAQKHEQKAYDSSWRFGYFLGARYYLSDNFGVFMEGGRNTLGWAKVGLTLKF